MGSKMKMTIDIADPILREARELASRDNTTLRALVEQGLQKIISERKRRKPFRARPVVFKGEGFQDGLQDADWERLRDMIYEDRGA